MKKKVCIIGAGVSRNEAPYDNPEYEIWSCNEMEAPRVDRYFEMHPMEVQNERELEWLKKCEKPVYVLKETPLVPMGVVYPLDKIYAEPWADLYWTCTFAHQIALAIYEGFEEILLLGMAMDRGSPRERTVESACIQWWCGIAIGMGIKVVWAEHPMYDRFAYGYNYHIEKQDIENWLARLMIHTIYRQGPTASMGGDNRKIRKLQY